MIMPIQGSASHATFPLTSQTLSRSYLTPDFNYSAIFNARIIHDRLRQSLVSFSPAEFTIIGLIGRSFLRLIENYHLTYYPALYSDLDADLMSLSEHPSSDDLFNRFLELYPTTIIYYAPELVSTYRLASPGVPENRYALYNSFLLVHTAADNPAIRKSDYIFTDPDFIKSPEYLSFANTLRRQIDNQSTTLGVGQNLLELLSAPSKAHPDSLEAQLNYIRTNWGSLLGEEFLNDLLRSLDQLKEENKLNFSGPGPVQNPLDFYDLADGAAQAPARFSSDQDWMPNLVLIAKNVFVWLDQLSQKYQETITQLDHIPDQELEELSSWGISGLWLIGLWERSSASQKIKQLCGNPDAIPSAYSLDDYAIAGVLGGEDAYKDLSDRARAYNIRLAADMVPNHMGINSRWVRDHPERFLSLEKSPFPSYSFSGPDLSQDDQIGIYLEDHYYSQTDAAVVFKRKDYRSGNESYIYHGNDGTAMPWNDTAQLDFLNPETREAVIQAIMHVAKKFSIIRFDAAMTLAKLHYQRLWYPEPGTGGAIPTRSEHGMTKKQFNKAMPREFWQEVVDRVALEAPDTLLLAEAFWMMEGYFVRTLGMHRVYNSAFMHMLRDETNKEFRELIIKTLEFDPQILKRYVNFMNNPDEETAISQFGSDGKYFGTCILLATLPGLPMFGHGQIEGYSEKYGMEYKRAYRDERPNQDLIDRHAREIFPLLKMRYLFADVANFHLLDMILPSGEVSQNLIAYTNSVGSDRALVVFHNSYSSIAGTLRSSSPVNGTSIPLLDALGLNDSESDYLLFKDLITGLEFIRSIEEVRRNGLEIALGAFQYQVLLDFKLVKSGKQPYSQLWQSLQKSGTPNLQDELLQIELDPILVSLTNIIDSLHEPAHDRSATAKDQSPDQSGSASRLNMLRSLDNDLGPFIPDKTEQNLNEIAAIIDRLQNRLVEKELSSSLLPGFVFFEFFSSFQDQFPSDWLSVLARLFDRRLNDKGNAPSKNTLIYYYLLREIHENLTVLSAEPEILANFWFQNQSCMDFLKIHSYQDQLWFRKEEMEELVDMTFTILDLHQKPPNRSKQSTMIAGSEISSCRSKTLTMLPKSKYLVDNFIKFSKTIT